MTTMKMRQLFGKRWIKICTGTIVALILIILLMPFGVKQYLADWLEKNGADSATIAKLRFNPFLGRVTLGGMEVQLDGRSILHNAQMILDLGVTSLFNRDIRLEKADYHDLSIELEQFKDGRWRFGSYITQGESEKTVEEAGEEVASAWNFLADHVVLTDCNVLLKTPELDMTLVIEKAELVRFSTREDQPAGSFSLKGKLNDGSVSLQLDTIKIVPVLRIGGTVSSSGFQLGDLSRSLENVLSTLAGAVSLDGQLLFVQEPNKGVDVKYNGSFTVTGEDIDSADFAATTESLSWKGQVHYMGLEKSPMQLELDGFFSASELDLSIPAIELVVEQSQLELQGKTSLTFGDTILIANEGTFALEGLELVLPPYGIVEEKIVWKGQVRYDSDHNKQGLLVHIDGGLDFGEFQFGGGGQSTSFAMGGQSVSWQGRVDYGQNGSTDGSRLELDGTAIGKELRTTLAEPQLQLLHGQVELNTKIGVNLGENFDISGLSSLKMSNFSLFEGTESSPLLTLNQFAITEIENRGGKSIAVRELETEGLKAFLSGKFPLAVEVPEIKLSDLHSEDLVSFQAGGLVVSNPLVTSVRNGKEVVRLEELAVNNVSFAVGGKLGIEKALVQNFAFLGVKGSSQKAAVSFSRAGLNDIKWSKVAGFEGDTLLLDDVVAMIVRSKDGNINISQQLAEMQQPESTGQEVEKPVEQGGEVSQNVATETSLTPPFSLKKTVVDGKSAVYFEDYTLVVPFIADLAISQLELNGFDSSHPDEKTELILVAELEKRAPLQISGQLYPFKRKPAVDIKLDLKNYPLSSLSAYTVQAVGTALASGQLQLKSTMALADDNLNMDNAILLKKLETKTISPDLAAKLNNQLPIPLDVALSMLRNSERNISLDIPLSGPVSDLNVGVSSVLITALSKAIIPAASGYLMYALGPYGALAYVGMKVGEKMLQVELPPLEFVQQETVLTPEHLNYLERIGKILQDRPETDIQICPQVASWEFLSEQQKNAVQGDLIDVDEKMQNELLLLGQKRAEAVQNLLENEYGVGHGRLLICDTKINNKKSAVPAVLLQL